MEITRIDMDDVVQDYYRYLEEEKIEKLAQEENEEKEK